jgi:hypothetical protein
MRGEAGMVERPHTGRRSVGIGLMVVGAALAVLGGVLTVTSINGSLKVQAGWAVPGSVAVHLAGGDWEIYELTGSVSGSSVGPFFYNRQANSVATIDSSDIQVTGPDGGVIATHDGSDPPNSFQTYTTGSRIYTGVATFHATGSGTYRISVAGSQAQQVIVARPPLAVFVSVIRSIVTGVVGAAMFLVGLILLILDIDRRRRPPIPAPYAYGAAGPWGSPYRGVAPGWHPDPARRYQYRYWNGVAWTEHASTGGAVVTDRL